MPKLPAAEARRTLSSALYLTLCACTVAQAVFGAPLPLNDHPARAVKTALEMRAELISVNDRLQKSGFKKLRHGIGIHN